MRVTYLPLSEIIYATVLHGILVPRLLNETVAPPTGLISFFFFFLMAFDNSVCGLVWGNEVDEDIFLRWAQGLYVLTSFAYV